MTDRCIGALLSDAERSQFISSARELCMLRVRFRHQGRTILGVDCAGLVVYALQKTGRNVIDRSGYGRSPFENGLRRLLRDNLGDPVTDMREGDVALMSFGGEPSHVGIITLHPLGDFALLHSYANERRVVEHRIDKLWNDFIKEIYRP